MKYKFILILIFWSVSCQAQNKKGRFSLGFNPLSLAESSIAFGPSFSYDLSRKFSIWAEASYVFKNSYLQKSWENVEGYRYIIQPRFFPYKNSSFFIAGEFRNKKISFTNTITFINKSTSDTLRNYKFPQELNYFGGAFIIGQKYFLNKRKSFFLEVTAGIGGRKRNPKLKNIPPGYEIQERIPSKGFSFRTDYEKSGSSYVLPLGFRLLWRLNREPKINEFYRPLLQR